MELINLIASIATAFGVFIAIAQLRSAKRQSVVEFEDSLNKEYRDLVKELPLAVLLNTDLSEMEIKENLNIFYRYIDLTNEQIYLRTKGRVSTAAWDSWEVGIRLNFSGPGLAKAWQHLQKINGHRFSELKRLLAEHAPSDPKKWQ